MKKSNGIIIAQSAIISLLLASITIGVSFTLFTNGIKSTGPSGEISLRSYYEQGSGTQGDPYVITRPRHLYNLSRLQGLGVYGTETWFQLGKVGLNGDDSGLPMCYVDETSEVKPYLDMTRSTYSNNPINAIGSEAHPFYGHFDGQNVEIQNINVYASPEDAGLFGYTAHGSTVRNLFLHNITINALGYTSEYDDLYSPDSVIGNDVSFLYDPDDNPNNHNETEITAESSDNLETTYYADKTGDDPIAFDDDNVKNDVIPTIRISIPAGTSSYYSFSSLVSGGLITSDGSVVTPDIDAAFEYFSSEIEKGKAEFPMQASSKASLIVSSIDGFGLKHSKVLLTLKFTYTMDSYSVDSNVEDSIKLSVYAGEPHSNNIGVIIGHCDGTCEDVYVSNATLKMNNGEDITEVTGYRNTANGTNYGLIGLVGGTVKNNLSDSGDGSIDEGKEIGVLDFTTIYESIINSSSFANSQQYGSGVTYAPVSTSDYYQYLRYTDESLPRKYITDAVDTVSFRGRVNINNRDLGVFTIVTDATTSGIDGNVGFNLSNSRIQKEDLAIDGKYYVYYATGEFNLAYNTQKATGIKFSQYLNTFSIDSFGTGDRAQQLLPGTRFPTKSELMASSMAVREQRQNYIVRFKLDPGYRKNHGFYFSDVDTSSDGGNFISNYFHYKLVDKNGLPIAADRPECGVMLKNTLGLDISKLSSSLQTPDLNKEHNYCTNVDGLNYVGNMVNFEITEKEGGGIRDANVTVIAASADNSKPAAVGIYKLDNNDFHLADNGYTEFSQSEPDYAFFIPDNKHLYYYDYVIDNSKSGTRKGEIVSYNDATGVNYTVADHTENTHATVAGVTNQSEYGYTSGKTRLFAHTFKLPSGRYCIGSVSSGDSLAKAKIYYLCAQGQNEGQLGYNDNVFVGNDRIDRVDFVKQARFAEYNGTVYTNITIPDGETITEITKYDPEAVIEDDRKKLKNQRCYVLLTNSDRSLFSGSGYGDITFNYIYTYNEGVGTDGKVFAVTTTELGSVLHVSINNYDPGISEQDEDKNFTIMLFDKERTVYSP